MFTIRGKVYHSLRELTHEKAEPFHSSFLHIDTHLYRDIHGRRVLYLYERFPCFDSYDYLYENRYYNWYFIDLCGDIAIVYHEDDSKEIRIGHTFCDEAKRHCSVWSSHVEDLHAAGFL